MDVQSHFFSHSWLIQSGLILGLGTLSVVLQFTSPAKAATFRCTDQSGATVLTDIPTQLDNCTALPTISPHLPSSSNPQHHRPSYQERLPNAEEEVSIDQPSQVQAIQASPLKEDITVPLTKAGGAYIVSVLLNQERTAQLILDTGASMTVLSTNVAIDLGLLGTTDNELLTVNTAGGSVQVNMNYLPSLQVGTAEAKHVAVAIHDLPDIPEHIEGLLGMSFLKNFLVTLDAEQSRLILRSKQQP